MNKATGRYARLSLAILAGLLGAAAQAADIGDLPDPTRPHGAAPAATGAPSGVQSILISPQRKLAVVHGRTVTIGDRVGDAVVVDIRPYEVILKRAGRESSLRLVPRLGAHASEGG
jgi:MSHA biogenesis protein MshK